MLLYVIHQRIRRHGASLPVLLARRPRQARHPRGHGGSGVCLGESSAQRCARRRRATPVAVSPTLWARAQTFITPPGSVSTHCLARTRGAERGRRTYDSARADPDLGPTYRRTVARDQRGATL